MRKTDGFTLIELMVGILCAALVTGSAMTLMLMGARSNRALLDANSEQQTARIITSLVESLASEGDIHEVYLQQSEEDDSIIGWSLLDSEGNSILSYSLASQAIYSQDNTPLMEGVLNSTLTLSKSKLSGSLLDISITTENNTYQTATYSRSATIVSDITLDSENTSVDITVGIPGDSSSENDIETLDPVETLDPDTTTGRFAFLEALCSQYGSTGYIDSPNGIYFSEWYLKAKYGNDTSYNQHASNGWSKETPWCACFVSWGIAQIKDEYLNSAPLFAHVESGYDTLRSDINGTFKSPEQYTPIAGDLIFFNWDSQVDTSLAPEDNGLDHIGVVFYCDSNYVYTIEGNTSIDNSGTGRVDLKRYYLNDTDIKGYGILDWKTNDQLNP